MFIHNFYPVKLSRNKDSAIFLKIDANINKNVTLYLLNYKFYM